jgi:hypothetical protein
MTISDHFKSARLEAFATCIASLARPDSELRAQLRAHRQRDIDGLRDSILLGNGRSMAALLQLSDRLLGVEPVIAAMDQTELYELRPEVIAEKLRGLLEHRGEPAYEETPEPAPNPEPFVMPSAKILADVLGVSRAAAGNRIAGRTAFSASDLVRLSEHFGVDLAELTLEMAELAGGGR